MSSLANIDLFTRILQDAQDPATPAKSLGALATQVQREMLPNGRLYFSHLSDEGETITRRARLILEAIALNPNVSTPMLCSLATVVPNAVLKNPLLLLLLFEDAYALTLPALQSLRITAYNEGHPLFLSLRNICHERWRYVAHKRVKNGMTGYDDQTTMSCHDDFCSVCFPARRDYYEDYWKRHQRQEGS